MFVPTVMRCTCRRRSLAQYGSFVGPKTVRVEGVDYTADHILVAVGGKPTLPSMEGAEHCINSNGFFELEVRPYWRVQLLQTLQVMPCGVLDSGRWGDRSHCTMTPRTGTFILWSWRAFMTAFRRQAIVARVEYSTMIAESPAGFSRYDGAFFVFSTALFGKNEHGK